ncbi:GGDEF domain-containing protein [Bacillus alkalicellulosilyticus]|uniref:GGDEF domain-containing protein n=1 Tax=Alkalihalobacterium alkalicellulosilyticum TaxID=1912214 RepID=UPI0009973B2A|nr:GGDEF domain-containing protein [Bacillus alkalicellulosilyticus]
MEDNNKFKMDYTHWTNKILQFYWLIVIISIIGQCIGLLITIYYSLEGTWYFILNKLILPTVIQVIAILACKYIINRKPHYRSQLLTITGTIVALVMILVHFAVPGLQVTLLLPMAVTIIYFDKRKLRFSFIINVLALNAIYLYGPVRKSVTEFEYMSYLFVLIAGYFIFLVVLQRTNEILQNLRQASEKEKELIVKNAIMERLSKVDALTGLYNHKTFHEYIDHLVVQSKKYAMPLQLAIVDIDNFKSINDTYGHSVGDIVLKRVAEAILSKVTEDDIVARYGGEEFAIILTNKSMEEAHLITEKVRAYIEAMEHEELDNKKVTVSIGLMNYSNHLTKLSFFQQTDDLLYQAKRTGKNKVIYK